MHPMAIQWTPNFARGFTFENNPPKQHVGVCGARHAYVTPVPGMASVWSVRCGNFSATFASFKDAKTATVAALRDGLLIETP